MEFLKNITSSALLFAVMLLCLATADRASAQQGLNDVLARAQQAGIEQSMLADLQEKARENGLSDEQLAELIQPALNLAKSGLPADHLIQKSLEGLSKGVPESRIKSFLGMMDKSTRQASNIIEPWMNTRNVQEMLERNREGMSQQAMRNNMIKASSRALAQNISEENIRGMLDEINDESILSKTTPANVVSAVNILPDLPFSEDGKLGRSLVVRALKGGFNAGEMQKLPAALQLAQKRSKMPAAGIAKGFSNQVQGGVPAADILNNLFRGNVGGGPPGNIPKGMNGNPGQGQGNRGGNGNGSGNGGGNGGSTP